MNTEWPAEYRGVWKKNTTSGSSGRKLAEILLVSPDTPWSFSSLLKPVDTLHEMDYIHYIGGCMDYIKQLMMERYRKTAAYRMELYTTALLNCGEALY